MLATSMAMATLTGGPVEGEVRKEGKEQTHTHLSTHIHFILARAESTRPSHHHFTPSSICFPPTHHSATSLTLLQRIEIKHYPV